MASPVRARRLTEQEGQKLQRIVRRGSTSSVRFRRAMMLLASSSGSPGPAIAQLVQADEDTVRDVIHRFNEMGLACLDPRWAGGRLRPGRTSATLGRRVAHSDVPRHFAGTSINWPQPAGLCLEARVLLCLQMLSPVLLLPPSRAARSFATTVLPATAAAHASPGRATSPVVIGKVQYDSPGKDDRSNWSLNKPPRG
ncbi:hypothetical protein FHS38_006470 [Streptomyces netropsis]|uniref:Transposase n=1 Tax=Streptomyces netropsis TaxID=55404 RepID=A0A7W7LHN6_STRNE|nr:helix-turn-helix domain-containing protein [Streptomyces netropsis]MBB4890385.1 hypothetical protein [Streptomyces netropsis]